VNEKDVHASLAPSIPPGNLKFKKPPAFRANQSKPSRSRSIANERFSGGAWESGEKTNE